MHGKDLTRVMSVYCLSYCSSIPIYVLITESRYASLDDIIEEAMPFCMLVPLTIIVTLMFDTVDENFNLGFVWTPSDTN